MYQTVEEFAYVIYNHVRPHSYNGYNPPFLKHGAPNDKYMACSKIPSAGGRKAATPLGLALDSRPKGCYAPKSDGGYKVKICS